MAGKIKNIIIFVAIAGIFAMIYIFYIKPPRGAALVSSVPPPATDPLGSGVQSPAQNPIANEASLQKSSALSQDFLTLLLSVKGIKLDDSIFSDEAFQNLRDSSIILEPDGNEGRPNPFAPLGIEAVYLPQSPPPSEEVSSTAGPTLPSPPVIPAPKTGPTNPPGPGQPLNSL